MGIKDSAARHWADQISGELQSVDVPEWGCVVYYNPHMTLEDRQAIERAQSERGMLASLHEVAFRKVCESDGTRVWSEGERTSFLRKYSPAVVERLGNEILKAANRAPTIGEAEGNSSAVET